MDWIDTLLLESRDVQQLTSNGRTAENVSVIPVSGVTLLHAKVSTAEQTAAALEFLRGFRATGRRVVLCDTSCLLEDFHAVERQLGHTLVQAGEMDMLVSCGLCGREVAIGARDEGLELANVVVCSDARSACEVLTHRLIPGDTVMLLGIDAETRARLILSLDKRLSRPAQAA